MSRNTIPLVVVFVVAFGAAFWLFHGVGGEELTTGGGRGAIDARDARAPGGPAALDGPDAIGPDPGQVGAPGTGEATGGSAEQADRGALEVTVIGDEQGIPGDLALTLVAWLGGPRAVGENVWRFDGVMPGHYVLQVAAEGYTTETRPGVIVRPGATTPCEVTLQRGTTVAGRVVDEHDGRPVEDALVEIGAILDLRTDAAGRFRSEVAVPYRALERIVVSAPGYDRVEYLRLPIKDPHEINLGLTSGGAQVTIRLLGGLAAPEPRWYRFRAWLTGMPGDPELRRDRLVEPTRVFSFDHLNSGTYIIAVEFPGTSIAGRCSSLQVSEDDDLLVDYVFDNAGRIEGEVMARAVPLAGRSVLLTTPAGTQVGEVQTDAGGRFTFQSVGTGEWQLRFPEAGGRKNSSTFEVAPGRVVRPVFDLDTRRTTFR